MTPNEFVLFYMILPWAAAALSAVGLVVVVVLGGGTLRTIIAAKLTRGSHLVLNFADGGLAELRRVDFKGEHGVLEDGRSFLLYATPLSNTVYTPQLLTAQEGTPAEVMKSIEAENARRTSEANRLNIQIPMLNDMAKKKSFLEGRPLWIGHAGLGVAFPPTLLKEMEASKIRVPKNSTAATFEAVSVDTIKDFVRMNFSRKRIVSIYRAGVDEGLYGRPRKPLSPIIVILAVLAAFALIIGVLILSGQVDLSGIYKGVSGGK